MNYFKQLKLYKTQTLKPHVNVGTIGHVDHGKTTLTAAITKVRSGLLWLEAVRVGPNLNGSPCVGVI